MVIRTDGGDDRATGEAIRHLVASAVPGMKIDDVTVLNVDGRLLASGSDSMDKSPDNLLALEREVSQEIRESVARTLTPYLSARNFQISVAARLNADKTQTSETIYNPDQRVERSVRVTKEQQSSQNAAGTQAAGVEANLPKQNSSGTEQKQSNDQTQKREELTNYEVSSKSVQTTSAGFVVQNLSVAVLVNRAALTASLGDKATPEAVAAQVKEIEQLVSSAAGLDKKRGDVVKISVVDFVEFEPRPRAGAGAVARRDRRAPDRLDRQRRRDRPGRGHARLVRVAPGSEDAARRRRRRGGAETEPTTASPSPRPKPRQNLLIESERRAATNSSKPCWPAATTARNASCSSSSSSTRRRPPPSSNNGYVRERTDEAGADRGLSRPHRARLRREGRRRGARPRRSVRAACRASSRSSHARRRRLRARRRRRSGRRRPRRRRDRRARCGSDGGAAADAGAARVARRSRGGEGRGNGACGSRRRARAAARRAWRSDAPRPRSGSPPSAPSCRSRRSWSAWSSSSTNTPSSKRRCGPGFAEVEARVGDAVARILGPFLVKEVVRYAVDELVKAIARLTAGGAPGLITIRGPERVLSLLRERVADLPAEVEYVEDERRGGDGRVQRHPDRHRAASPGRTCSPPSTR